MSGSYCPIAGLDKVTLHNVSLRAIVDWSKLSQDNVTWYPARNPREAYRTEDGKNFGFLQIKEAGPEASFRDLTFGYEYGKWGNITFTPSHVYGENLHNMTVSIMWQHLSYLTEYLEVRYGIVVDFTSSIYSEMEMNITFPLEKPYFFYNRSLLAISQNMPYYKNKNIIRNDKKLDEWIFENNSIAVGGNSLQIVVYNKTKELHDKKIPLPDGVEPGVDYMRVEFRLLTTDKIEHVFGKADVRSIAQDDVQNKYRALFDRYFRKGYKTWVKSAGKRLRSKVRDAFENRFSGKKQWVSSFFKELRTEDQGSKCPLILDKKQLHEEFRELPIKHGNKARVLKAIDRQLGEKDVDVFNGEGLSKIEEIFTKAEYACGLNINADAKNNTSNISK